MTEILSRQERLAMLLDELLQTMSPSEAIPPLLAALVASCTKAGLDPTGVVAQFMSKVPKAAGVATDLVGTVRGIRRIITAFR